MKGLSYLFLYVPIVLAILLVLEACRTDDPKRILTRSLANFGVLTGVLSAGGFLVYLVNRFL
jgi:hypothetical protein